MIGNAVDLRADVREQRISQIKLIFYCGAEPARPKCGADEEILSEIANIHEQVRALERGPSIDH